MTECNQVLFPWGVKKVEALFDTEPLSSDGGMLLLRSADEQLRLIERAASFLADTRDPSKVAHELLTLLRQRVYGICAGYEDCNDADHLCSDPVHELTVGAPLASQPTLSRFENAQGWRVLKGLNELLLKIALPELKHAKEIVLDFDSTDDETHGNQQLAFFHGYYDQHMYHPLLVFANQRLIFVLLRPGNCHAGRAVTPVGRKLIERLRAGTSAKLTVRADAGFALPRFYKMLEAQGVEYTIGLITNDVLRTYADAAMGEARTAYQVTQQPGQRFGSVMHQAGSWQKPRRVIYKAEALVKGENRRFVVTNREDEAEAVYLFYRGRGDMENRLKDLKNALQGDRTSCHRFVANAFRLLEHALAYMLMDHLRRATPAAAQQRLQFDTLRLRLIKIGAMVQHSVRRCVVHLPSSYPWTSIFLQTAISLARPAPT
jgi:hypothetical protein